MDAVIRAADEADLPAVLELYNARIAHDTGLWTETLQTLEERSAWFAQRRAAGDGVYVAELAGAVDGENEGSVTFHERLGFEVVGRLPELGGKFGRWLDLVFLHRCLD